MNMSIAWGKSKDDGILLMASSSIIWVRGPVPDFRNGCSKVFGFICKYFLATLAAVGTRVLPSTICISKPLSHCPAMAIGHGFVIRLGDQA